VATFGIVAGVELVELFMRGLLGNAVALDDLAGWPAWHENAACRGAGPAQFFVERGGGPVRPPYGSMVAFGVQPEFTCNLAVAGEEHGTDDADDVAGVRFVGVLKLRSDGCIERLFLHGAT